MTYIGILHNRKKAISVFTPHRLGNLRMQQEQSCHQPSCMAQVTAILTHRDRARGSSEGITQVIGQRLKLVRRKANLIDGNDTIVSVAPRYNPEAAH